MSGLSTKTRGPLPPTEITPTTPTEDIPPTVNDIDAPLDVPPPTDNIGHASKHTETNGKND